MINRRITNPFLVAPKDMTEAEVEEKNSQKDYEELMQDLRKPLAHCYY